MVRKQYLPCFKPIAKIKFIKVIDTDASFEGWGASYGNTPIVWLPDEKRLHIIVLELKAIFLALKTFIKTKNEHGKVIWDNTTAISCINKMETSRSMVYHYLTIRIWEWTMKTNIHLKAAYISGKQNITADGGSKVFHVDLE